MPSRRSDPRRSDGSVVVAAPDDADAAAPAPQTPAADAPAPPSDRKDKDPRDRDAVVIEDLILPKSIITRLAKGVLPPNTQIQANAILAMSKSATVFISYLASHANEHTTNANKKTISPADVFKALDDTEFSFLRAPLEAEFAKFNAIQTQKRSSYRQKARAAREGHDADIPDHHPPPAPRAAAPRAKRPRVEPRDDAETDDDADDADDDDDAPDDDDDDDQDDDDVDEDGSGDETQDALEDRTHPDERDEALDADDSD